MKDFPEHLLNGYRTFMEGRYQTEAQRYRALADRGQSPTIMVVSCCDSRSAPETIFDAGPGEMFVVRNVANLVPPYGPDGQYHGTSAALEFAVQSLEDPRHPRAWPWPLRRYPGRARFRFPAAVAGRFHRQVDGIAGSCRRTDQHLRRPDGRRAADRARTGLDPQLHRQSAHFPCVSILEGKGKLRIHGAWFDISTGELWVMNPETGDFVRSLRL